MRSVARIAWDRDGVTPLTGKCQSIALRNRRGTIGLPTGTDDYRPSMELGAETEIFDIRDSTRVIRARVSDRVAVTIVGIPWSSTWPMAGGP
jgi:hypothetical protein